MYYKCYYFAIVLQFLTPVASVGITLIQNHTDTAQDLPSPLSDLASEDLL